MAHDLFGPVIYSYTDEQAREDGVLVAVSRKDRVTQAAFNFLAEHLTPRPPSQWPVDMMGYFRAKDGEDRALAAANGLISVHGPDARRIYENNIGGGIWEAWAVSKKDGALLSLFKSAPTSDEWEATKLWLIPNEMGGLTLLFPEDY